MANSFIAGTKGYEKALSRFIESTHRIRFTELHHDFLPFIPSTPCLVLDVGAGIGRDAAVLAEMGHEVLAVEPLKEFRVPGQSMYRDRPISWMDDSLPALDNLKAYASQVDFVLASGVWHHLAPEEQQTALNRVAQLMKKSGIFAASLRHGPAGAGTHVFPIDVQQTIKQAEQLGLTCLLLLENQPSLLPNKAQVNWTRVVWKKD
ncbi:MAG: class I SAM-dependent methyltransferase [Bacteroidota bacterium]